MSAKKRLNRLSAYLRSNRGRLFFHILYSVGASVVIIGALAKILHMSWGNILLIIGMVTEAIVFFLSAFDVDQIDYDYADGATAASAGGVAIIGGGNLGGDSSKATIATGSSAGASVAGSGGTTIIGGGGVIGGGAIGGVVSGGSGSSGVAAASSAGAVSAGGGVAYNPSNFSPEYVENMGNAAKELEGFGKTMTSLNEVSQALLATYQQISEGTNGLTQTSAGFSDNVKVLNENIDSINSIFESQMQSIKDQINTIKYINGSLERIKSLYDNTVIDSDAFRIENERMTRQIQELNRVYARLLQAMNVGGGYNQGGGYGQGGGYNPPL